MQAQVRRRTLRTFVRRADRRCGRLPPGRNRRLTAAAKIEDTHACRVEFPILAPALLSVGAVGLINLRHALYSASVAPILLALPRRWKLLLAYLLTDEAYAAAIPHLLEHPKSPTAHWVPFVPIAALTALAVPELLLVAGHVKVVNNPKVWAGLIAIAVAARWRNTLLTIGAGFAALWFLRWLS